MSAGDALLAFLSRQDILLLFLLVGTGAIAGRVRLGSIELGAAAVLFIGMALSALGESRGYRIVVPEAFGTLGLVLFTFSVGNMSGASFFASLRREYGAILTTVAILVGAALVAVVVGRLLGLGSASVAGSFAGAGQSYIGEATQANVAPPAADCGSKNPATCLRFCDLKD